ncbi:MAG: segregation/condensation protein A [Candidatus Saganbacteria bacterium]|nr:segregation/condensation protein A [Candidatus Saganbacteria bacterium]
MENIDIQNIPPGLQTVKMPDITTIPSDMLEAHEGTGAFTVTLPIFEGHFDALLDMLEKKKMDICDISLTDITRQYLEYLSLAQSLNLSFASEFLVIAAYLLEQKSRAVLPKEEEEQEEEEKIGTSLVDHLMQYRVFKSISQSLKEKKELFSRIFHRSKGEQGPSGERNYVLRDLGVEDLVSAFRKIWLEVRERGEEFEIADDVMTVGDKIKEITGLLSAATEGVVFEALFRTKTRLEVIITFLALLEMIRSKAVIIKQEKMFGQIMIIPAGVESL